MSAQVKLEKEVKKNETDMEAISRCEYATMCERWRAQNLYRGKKPPKKTYPHLCEAPGSDKKNLKHLLTQKHFAHVQKVKAVVII